MQARKGDDVLRVHAADGVKRAVAKSGKSQSAGRCRNCSPSRREDREKPSREPRLVADGAIKPSGRGNERPTGRGCEERAPFDPKRGDAGRGDHGEADQAIVPQIARSARRKRSLSVIVPGPSVGTRSFGKAAFHVPDIALPTQPLRIVDRKRR